MNIREEFVANFREIHPKFTRLYTTILNRVNLTLPQYALLNQLEHLGPISMTEISEKLRITKPAVTNLVDRLETKRFLRRSPHPNDRRIILLEILSKGKKILAEIQTSSLSLLLKAYDQFNVSEHQTISRFYAALSKAMDEFLARTKHEK
ncbi:MAG TPA: MarR family transcriptional regulator [Candidatus Omnitrophota bacterium]|nr:MarR family transcriptional regulator [Candidatus Omnitrophota bacterium]